MIVMAIVAIAASLWGNSNAFHGAGPFSDCSIARVGSSPGRNQKSITIATGIDGLKCPTMVDKTNWITSHTYGDTFSVDQNGSVLTVTRTDSNEGWGMDLTIRCCPADPCSDSPQTHIYKYKKLCGHDCTAMIEGKKLAREINTSLKGCEEYCDRTKGCKSFTYCRGGRLCYVREPELKHYELTIPRSDKCNSYRRTCEPISRVG